MHIETYYLQRRVEYARSVKGRKKIFLDTNFWIYLRDASLCTDGGVGSKLLEQALAGVRDGRYIFPVSHEILVEIFAQTEKKSIYKSCELIDELSEGMCIIPCDARKELELFNQFREIENEAKLEISEMAWTKTPYDSGLIFGPLPGLKNYDLLNAQIKAIDDMWNKSLRDRIEVLDYGNGRSSPRFPDISEILNEQKNKHKDTFNSRCEAYLALVHTDLNDCGDLIQIDGEGDYVKLRKSIVNDIQNHVYKHTESGTDLERLSSIHIPAAIFSAIHWDKRRKFKKNDWLDFQHATAALSFCDLFFTEGPLKSLITRKDLNLDNVYNCVVLSTPEDASEILRQQS